MQRIDDGRPLREAIQRAGMSAQQLADATRRIDPEHRGVSRAYIGHLSRSSSSGRQTCGRETAELIAKALDADIRELFIEEPSDSSMPTVSTSTVEGRNSMNSSFAPTPLLTQKELQSWLRRSNWWVDQQIKHHGLPVQYIRGTGRQRARRFDPTAVALHLGIEPPTIRENPAA